MAEGEVELDALNLCWDHGCTSRATILEDVIRNPRECPRASNAEVVPLSNRQKLNRVFEGTSTAS